MQHKNEISAYLENISLLLLGLFLLFFPLAVIHVTTDPFLLPKQALLGIVAVATLLLLGAKMISDGNLRLRKTPIDLPLWLFGIAILLSAVFSINRIDGLIVFAPLFFALILYFTATNFAKSESSISFLITSFIAGAGVTAILAILSFLKIYVLPFAFAKSPTFTPIGSLLDQAIFLAIALSVAGYFARPLLRDVGGGRDIRVKEIGFATASILLLISLIITIYQLVGPASPSGGLGGQKPLLLPFPIGFQTAFAAISQDTSRLFWGFLFGSGVGTFLTDFTRFKPAAINLDGTLWSAIFFRSSSFILELLATTGMLGILAFGFLVFRLVKYTFKEAQLNPLFTALLLLLAASLILPFSPFVQILLVIILALFVAVQGLSDHHNFYDIDLKFVAFKNGIYPFESLPADGHSAGRTSATKILPVSFFVGALLLSAALGFLATRYVASDVLFQNSTKAQANNNGLQTYNNQVSAISLFPWRDGYYRVYSQTNIALANSLASQQPRESSPSAETQQTITTLIQQAINSGRRATAISPLNTGNWQNLSSIYRSLIGFGQNAENFAIVSAQQATALDPNNPQQYINLGGIFFQLQKWEDAQRQFQIAVNLKPDFANAYYNLGHALENKGDLQTALAQYQIVKRLIANDKENSKRIDEEIAVLQQKIGSAEQTSSAQPTSPIPPTSQQPPLGVSTPSAQLPEQKKPVEIPGPASNAVSAPSDGALPSTTPSVSPKPSISPTL